MPEMSHSANHLVPLAMTHSKQIILKRLPNLSVHHTHPTFVITIVNKNVFALKRRFQLYRSRLGICLGQPENKAKGWTVKNK